MYDVTVAYVVINDNSGNEGEILHRDFVWETIDNYSGHGEVFSCDFGPRNGAENVILSNVSSYFLTNKYNRLLEKLIGMQNNTATRKAIFYHFVDL
jgi:hypothetical protein